LYITQLAQQKRYEQATAEVRSIYEAAKVVVEQIKATKNVAAVQATRATTTQEEGG